jgi:hypothetical protein
MPLTEEEAKTKWCPYARGITDGGGNRMAYGSSGDGPAEDDYTAEMAAMYPCIGSACMAWRRATRVDKDGTIWLATSSYTSESTEAHLGYCGLAGKPD